MLNPTELPSFPQIEEMRETWKLIKKEIGRFWDGMDPDDVGAGSTALDLSVNITDDPPCGGVFSNEPCLAEVFYGTVEAPFSNSIDGVDAT